MWNFNLADAAFGYLVLEIQDGRIGTEMRAQGFNFSHRGARQQPGNASPAPTTATSAAPLPAAPPPANRQASAGQPLKPTAPPSGPAKPATPQPAQGSEKDAEKTPSATNGSANGPELASSPAPKTPIVDSIGLFIMNVNTEEQCRGLFDEEDKPKIVKIVKLGTSTNKVVHFSTIEDRDGAMARLPEEVKSRTQEDRTKPLVKIFQPREGKPYSTRGVLEIGVLTRAEERRTRAATVVLVVPVILRAADVEGGGGRGGGRGGDRAEVAEAEGG